jgi:glycosyltransferase involved in cell wall biosynthesis
VPTLGHEAFGLVAAEAFAHGTPAVVPRFGALGELVSDSGGGLSYGTDDELDAALSTLAGDQEQRTLLGARAREAFLAQWTVDRHLDRYFALVAAVAEERGDRRLADRAAAARSRAALPS